MGYPRQRSQTLQPGTLIYHLSGYDPSKVDFDRLKELYNEALSAGKISTTDHAPGVGKPYHQEIYCFGGNCIHVTDIDAGSSEGKTLAELKARESLKRTYHFLRQVPGLETLEVDFAANECGIRETWRIVGLADVTYETYTSGFVWPDAICYSFFPIDIHQNDSNRMDTRPLKEGIVATIPYRSLIPKGSERVLAAGRCISGDTEASSAYRVQASCMAIGQAAGVAAVLSADKNITMSQVDVAELRQILTKYHAIVP